VRHLGHPLGVFHKSKQNEYTTHSGICIFTEHSSIFDPIVADRWGGEGTLFFTLSKLSGEVREKQMMNTSVPG
jgi:hypothetical protein